MSDLVWLSSPMCFLAQEPDQWIDELEDLTCQEKESKVELACKFSKPTAKVRWYKNKLEIFQGPKYNMSSEDGIFRLFINRIGREDAGKYACQADVKFETACYLTVEGLSYSTYFIVYLIFFIIHSFIADIYIAPLQAGLLRSASSPSVAK